MTETVLRRATALRAQGYSVAEAAAELGVGESSLYRGLATAAPATTNGAAMVARAPHERLGPPTENDRKVDALVAGSRTWRRVRDALAAALADYPDARRAVVRALETLEL